MNPVDEGWRDVEVVKFVDLLVALNCTEGGAEINKEDCGKVAWSPQRPSSLVWLCRQTGGGPAVGLTAGRMVIRISLSRVRPVSSGWLLKDEVSWVLV